MCPILFTLVVTYSRC